MNQSTNEVQETDAVAVQGTATTSAVGGKAARTVQEYEQMVSELRKENAGHRLKLKDLEASEARRREADMSETEKAQARIKELEEQSSALQRKAQDSEIRAHAAALKFADPSDGVAFIERELIEDDGRNIPELLSAVLKAKPYLSKDAKAIPSTSAANPGGGAEKASEKAREEELRKAFPTLGRRV
jgi:predicted nuclease with TOPRIM domain